MSNGFNNWKKALQRFAQHARSEYHLRNLPPSRHPITKIFEKVDAKQQKTNRTNLIKLITSIMYLTKQGVVIMEMMMTILWNC